MKIYKNITPYRFTDYYQPQIGAHKYIFLSSHGTLRGGFTLHCGPDVISLVLPSSDVSKDNIHVGHFHTTYKKVRPIIPQNIGITMKWPHF
jgi:hypothetical protein